jgi:hypothetical protein
MLVDTCISDLIKLNPQKWFFFFFFQVTNLSSSSKISEVHAQQKIELQDQISKIESKLRDVEERTKKIYNNIPVRLNFSLIVHSVSRRLHFH